MYSHNIPVEIDDFVNTMTYPIEAPEYAMPKSNIFELGELDQLFIPDKHSMVSTRATIAKMIDMCDKSIKFRILYSDDIIEIYRYVNEYIRQLSVFHEVEEAAKYLVKANHFVELLQRSVNILAKTHPKAKMYSDAYNLTNIFQRSVGIGGSSE